LHKCGRELSDVLVAHDGDHTAGTALPSACVTHLKIFGPAGNFEVNINGLLDLSVPLISIGALVGFGSSVAFWTRQSGWKRDMKEFAKANNFELLGKELPDGFVFRGTSLHDPEIANVMKETLHGLDMVVFRANSCYC
jgi:hypothetical protein